MEQFVDANVLLNNNGSVAANVPGWVSDQAVADALAKLAAQQ